VTLNEDEYQKSAQKELRYCLGVSQFTDRQSFDYMRTDGGDRR